MNSETPRSVDQKKAMAYFIVVSATLWVTAVVVSGKLAGKEGTLKSSRPAEERGNLASQSDDGTVMVSPESARLRKAVEEQPSDSHLLLQLAASLKADAKQRPSPGLVMEAVRAYSRALDLNKDDPEALLGLANLCFEADILDKAVEYYARYLQKHAGDLEASTDYSLALIQGGQIDKAVAFLTPLAEAHPDRFQMRLTLAVAEKLRGNLDKAKQEADLALEHAPSDDARDHVKEFLVSLSSAPASVPVAASAIPAAALSPASLIEQFFTNHPIVGPKVKRITWPEANIAEVHVSNFPVEQMPQFAKEKFLGSVKSALQVLPEKITIRLIDEETDKNLLEIEAGGSSGGAVPAAG